MVKLQLNRKEAAKKVWTVSGLHACMSVASWPRHVCFFQMPLQGMFFLVIQLYSCTITGSCACFHHQGLSLLCSLQWCLNTFTCCSSVWCVGVMAAIVMFREMNTQIGNAQVQCKCMCIQAHCTLWKAVGKRHRTSWKNGWSELVDIHVVRDTCQWHLGLDMFCFQSPLPVSYTHLTLPTRKLV